MNLNLANRITILRILMIPVFLFILLYQPFGLEISRYIGMAIFILASATDALDGYIARSRNLITNLGKFLDPLADKLLVASALVVLVGLGELSSLVVIIIISREFIITGFRGVAADANIIIAASEWGKMKTIVQMVMIPILLLGIDGRIIDIIETILVTLSVILAIVSAWDYIFKNKQVLLESK